MITGRNVKGSGRYISKLLKQQISTRTAITPEKYRSL